MLSIMIRSFNNMSQISFEESFASHEKSKYWSKKNNIDPKTVRLNSHKEFVFDCVKCGHEFVSRLDRINKGGWCPYCHNKLCDNVECDFCFKKSFASCDKAQYLNDSNGINARDISLNSHKKISFDCNQCDHTFEMAPNNINNGGQWCSFCSNTKLCGDINCDFCFNKSFALHVKSQFWSDKNNVKPFEVHISSSKEFYFDCDDCGHELLMKLNAINEGSWCMYCASFKLCDDDQCNYCFNKSFASHDRAIYWSDTNKISPRSVFLNSNTKYYFICDDCNHEIQLVLSTINAKDYWCQYCSNQKLCLDTTCELCFDKSFASHEKSIYWSTVNEKLATEVFKQSNVKYYFLCDQCDHIFGMTPSHVTVGHWCGFCGNRQLCGCDNCQLCFDKSFASHEKAIFWSKQNEIEPNVVFKGTPQQFYFDCDQCNRVFYSRIDNIVHGGTWCPYCKNKTENKLFQSLSIKYPSLLHGYYPNWCINKLSGRCLPFDFIIPEYNIIIELDGEQHFRQVANWKSPEDYHKRDVYKMKRANNNNYRMIRILQTDVYYDKYDWLSEMIANIKLLGKSSKILNIYMCKNNEYSVFNTK